MSERATGRFTRPPLERTAPKRGAIHFYRAASDDPGAVAGVTLDSVEDAVVAAVRMGYKVASAQIDRSARLATRLREAGTRAAGPHSERQALDATEQLVFRTMMAGLSWFEGFSTESGNPLKRLAQSNYRILGSLLGLLPADATTDEGPGPTAGSEGAGTSRTPPPADAARTGPARPGVRLRLRHAGPERRPIRPHLVELAPDLATREFPLVFYCDRRPTMSFDGSLTVTSPGSATLTIRETPSDCVGRWKAAVCDDDGLQVGYIAIEL
jgi:hypothetical protein